MIVLFAFLVLTYALAAIPFAVVVPSLWGDSDADVREGGSGNPGATNVARLYGWRLGGAVMVLDVCKAFLPVLLARLLWPAWDPWWGILIAVIAFLAHVFPIYLEFRGGKGVATAAGGLLALAPIPTLGAAALWAVLLAITGRSSVAALGASAAAIVISWWLAPQVLLLAAILAVAVAVTHTSNLRRLFRGQEAAVIPPVRWSRDEADAGERALQEGPAGVGPAPEDWPEPLSAEE
ncbi:MAG: glycerol-3-phosphate 1-O-acyltransferase [Deltaproteobacteria bacterium]|nr:MAG: glycerol-3-phosphate 1-O-acyltransferase [Deltaproteobacteria bacterium]